LPKRGWGDQHRQEHDLGWFHLFPHLELLATAESSAGSVSRESANAFRFIKQSLLMRSEIIRQQFFARRNLLASGTKDDYRQNYAKRETFSECGNGAA
jgi:hypothetical protein